MKINKINTGKNLPYNASMTYKGLDVQLPTEQRNYTIFDTKKVDYYVAQKEQALPYVKEVLANSQDEKQIVEALYILDRLIDNGTKSIPEMYPLLSKFNNTQSPNIQAFLAGIYRKIQVPDAFGPLVAMLIKNSIKAGSSDLDTLTRLSGKLSPQGREENLALQPPFDPNEEIGGAILEYIQNYAQGPKKRERAEAEARKTTFFLA